MTDIVAYSSYKETEAVEHVQIEHFVQLTVLNHVVAHLGYINSVQIVMILNVLFICSLDFLEEFTEACLIYDRY